MCNLNYIVDKTNDVKNKKIYLFDYIFFKISILDASKNLINCLDKCLYK